MDSAPQGRRESSPAWNEAEPSGMPGIENTKA